MNTLWMKAAKKAKVTEEQLLGMYHEWCEKMVNKNQLMLEWWALVHLSSINKEMEDYCLDILNGSATALTMK